MAHILQGNLTEEKRTSLQQIEDSMVHDDVEQAAVYRYRLEPTYLNAFEAILAKRTAIDRTTHLIHEI